MPLFPNFESDYTFKGRTHTNLVVSEGDAPAQEWVVAKDETVKFQYVYGPEGNQNVVIAKGKLVEAAGLQYDAERNRTMNAVKTATANSTKVLGVNHHNLYERKRDRFSGGNQGNPNLITRSYIELPLFEHATLATAQGYASAMKFGAAYGEAGANALMPGDYVKVGVDGNFVKMNTATDNPFMAVGQVLGVEKELPPAGFLQYYLDMSIPQLEEFMKQKSIAPSPGNGGYPYGAPYEHGGWKADFEKLLNPSINKGIPFLTDGYFRARQTVTGVALTDVYDATTNNDGHIENVVTSGAVTVTGANVAVDANTRNAALFIKLRHEIDMTKENQVTVKYDASATATPDIKTMSSADVHIDYTNNLVVVYLEPGKTYKSVALDAELVVNPVAGIPTEWDYAGSVGAVRILLQK